jgi:dTDP-glucose 4,6-dehydratase
MRLDDGRAVPNFICQALRGQPLTLYGEGQQTRSFCYINDLVDGLYRLLMSDAHEPVNLGNPTEITIAQLAEVVNQLTDNSAGVRSVPEGRAPADPQRRQPDITRARALLGWSPTTDLEAGMSATIVDFRARL